MAAPNATPELEWRGVERVESPTTHAAMRTVQSLGGVVLGAAALQASLFVPGVARVFGVSAVDGAVTCGLVVAGVTLATVAYWISGLSRLYFWAEYAESALAAAGYSNLILASDNPQSVFWLLYLAHVLVLGSAGTNVRNSVLLGVTPSAPPWASG
jgi:hypothetical protein